MSESGARRAPGGERVVTVATTAPDEESAEALVRALLDAGAIACGQVLPGAMSLYRWKGELRREREVAVALKTLARQVPRLRDLVARLHPYEVPELLVHDVVDGSPAYLEWVRSECAAEAP